MKSSLELLLASAILALGTSCSGSHRDDPAPTNFTSFVQGIVSSTSETAEPVSIDGREFSFSEDPAAFDALFQ